MRRRFVYNPYDGFIRRPVGHPIDDCFGPVDPFDNRPWYF